MSLKAALEGHGRRKNTDSAKVYVGMYFEEETREESLQTVRELAEYCGVEYTSNHSELFRRIIEKAHNA